MCTEEKPRISAKWISRFTPPIVYIIKNHPEEEILIDTCAILAYFCVHSSSKNLSRLVQDKDLWSRVVSFLYSSNYRLVAKALGVSDRMLTTRWYRENLVDSGMLSAFSQILQNSAMPWPQRKTVWSILAQHTSEELAIQAVLDNEDLLVVIIGSLEKADEKTQECAIDLICYLATEGTIEHTRRLMDFGIFDAYRGLCIAWHRSLASRKDRECAWQALSSIKYSLDRATEPARKVHATVLEAFGIMELLDDAVSGPDPDDVPLSARAKQVKGRYFQEQH